MQYIFLIKFKYIREFNLIFLKKNTFYTVLVNIYYRHIFQFKHIEKLYLSFVYE